MNVWLEPVSLSVATPGFDIDIRDGGHLALLEKSHRYGALRQKLDAGWQAVRSLKGDDIIACTSLLLPLLETHASACASSHGDEIKTLVAIGYLWRDECSHAMSLARTVLERSQPSRFRSALVMVVRWGCWRTRNLQSFYRLARPHRHHPATALSRIVELSIDAVAEAEQLRFKLAERLAKEAIDLACRTHEVSSHASLLATCVLANLAYEVGAIDDADRLIRGKTPALEQFGTSESNALGFTVSARIALVHGNPALALLMLRKAREIGMRRGWLRVLARAAGDEVAVHLAQRHLDMAQDVLTQAQAWVVGQHPAIDDLHEDTWPLDIARYRLAWLAGACDTAARGFAQLRDLALNRSQLALAVRLTLLLAASLLAGGREEAADNELLDALQWGAEAGLYRTFVDELPLIEPGLRRMRTLLEPSQGYLNPYIGSLLAAAGSRVGGKRKTVPQQGAKVVLSAKETVILRLISLGLSNKHIARELGIAPETVKSHAKRIFVKLSTKTRAEAVARGNELGLI